VCAGVIAAVGRVTGRNVPIRVAGRRPGDPARLVASADRITRELGWSARHTSLEEIVASAWRYMRDHPAQ